jgi:Protein of unknown function (DUF4232)
MSTVKLVLGTTAAAALTVTVLAGCASGTTSTTAPASSTPAASGGASAAAAAAATSAAPAGTAAAAPSAGGSKACATSDLSLQVIQGAQEQSSTGSFYIQLTNVSGATCTLYGFPGIDLAGSDGASLGMKDVWTVKNAMSGGEHTQTLAPNTSSAAFVTYPTEPAAQTKGDPQAAEVRVIPPDQTTALTAKIDNLYQGAVQLPVVSKTLTVGPMDIDGVPHQ